MTNSLTPSQISIRHVIVAGHVTRFHPTTAPEVEQPLATAVQNTSGCPPAEFEEIQKYLTELATIAKVCHFFRKPQTRKPP
jgi:hypothetical protein